MSINRIYLKCHTLFNAISTSVQSDYMRLTESNQWSHEEHYQFQLDMTAYAKHVRACYVINYTMVFDAYHKYQR